MVRYEETYCKLLTGEYTGSESVIKMALIHVKKEIEIHRKVLDELKDDCHNLGDFKELVNDYYKYINAILIYKDGLHISE